MLIEKQKAANNPNTTLVEGGYLASIAKPAATPTNIIQKIIYSSPIKIISKIKYNQPH